MTSSSQPRLCLLKGEQVAEGLLLSREPPVAPKAELPRLQRCFAYIREKGKVTQEEESSPSV